MMTCGSTVLQGGNDAKRVEMKDPRTEEILPFTVTTHEQLFELKEKLLSDSTDPATATTRTSKQSRGRNSALSNSFSSWD